MKVIRGRVEAALSEERGATFTGSVWADPVMSATDGVTINNVFFTPGGRTHWHTHEQGQVLQVTGGKGWICKDGEAPQAIRAGDVVWIGPHERHWHGAAQGSYMIHTATSIGATLWEGAVTAAEYPTQG